MRTSYDDAGVTGGNKSKRISRFQNFLRRSRLDELPQLLNILRGDMSFVGPRPPLRVYVEDYPKLYAAVLRSRPGVTGLATLKVHGYEEQLLSECFSSDETDQTYRKRCIPKKAAIDLIYQQHANFCYDVLIVVKTTFRIIKRR